MPQHLAKAVINRIVDARKIQLRVATIMCNLPHRPRLQLPKPPAPPQVSWEDLMSVTMHQIRHDTSNNRLTCLTCFGATPHRSAGARAWLTAACVVPVRSMAPVRVLLPLVVGHQCTHDSHKLYNMRGVIFCMLCGNTAGKTIKELAKPCPNINGGARKPHGQTIVRQLSEGRLPVHVRRTYGDWPDEVLHLLPPIAS